MQIYSISMHELRITNAHVVNGKRGRYFCLTHGEDGRGRWQLRLPLAAREFPVTEDVKNSDVLKLEGEFNLVDLKRKDPQGNESYLLVNGQADGKQLILLSLNPGFRGGASYNVSGHAEVIGIGEQAQGDAGRMGGADCPLILVSGPCRFEWERYGRLYGNPSKWVADFDGETWSISPSNECAVEEAALNY